MALQAKAACKWKLSHGNQTASSLVLSSSTYVADGTTHRKGQFLAVGWSDGVVRLMGLETSKPAHQIPVGKENQTGISHIGWASCRVPLKADPFTAKAVPELALSPDLPSELTFLQVESALPKLCPLPASSAGADDDATFFTLNEGIDFILRPLASGDGENINVMVIGTREGQIQLNVWDFFRTGLHPNPLSNSFPGAFMISHSSHARVSTHALVFAEDEMSPEQIHLIPMDLSFISQCPINLALLGHELTSLQILHRYVRQTQLHMQVEWRNIRELPRRFLRILQVDLQADDRGPKDIVTSFHHTLLLGHAYKPMRAWLVDVVAERGHKRWDKAVVTGLERLRSLLHESFLPSLERCAIILSRLRGLAQFYEDRAEIGFSATMIAGVLDVNACLYALGHKVTSLVTDELDYFITFSEWLRLRIDYLGPSEVTTEDLSAREAVMDTSKVLTYIKRFLVRSPIDFFFEEGTGHARQPATMEQQEWRSMVSDIDVFVNRAFPADGSMEASATERRFKFSFLVEAEVARSRMIFQGVADAIRRSIRFGPPINMSVLGGRLTLMDVRVCDGTASQSATNMGMTTQTATIYTVMAAKANQNRAFIFRSVVHIKNGLSSSQPTDCTCIDVTQRNLIDAKFLNDDTLILLCDQAGTILTTLLPLASAPLPWTTMTSSPMGDVPTVQLESLSGHVSEFVVPPPYAFRPVKMGVCDKANVRGEIPVRISLLANNGSTWRTFTLPDV
ncbi:hypothetical protein AAL_01845 [Moelleriella libera RCEF 2490]|uniref:Anaphase-promoting complex subunit 4 n=1 Tax=Moelleriella libera RCEF 2490 TaxID=1081109 RepID=A0A168EYC5_9HYPO|nr:hypothetical protein AAL_01845 [Moelleriella libera RCEF 2490]